MRVPDVQSTRPPLRIANQLWKNSAEATLRSLSTAADLFDGVQHTRQALEVNFEQKYGARVFCLSKPLCSVLYY